jgi:hypothetical protein
MNEEGVFVIAIKKRGKRPEQKEWQVQGFWVRENLVS